MINRLKSSRVFRFLSISKRKIINTIAPLYGTRKIYYSIFGEYPNLSEPHDFNEKILYLKLNDYYKNKKVTQCADKYAVRGYIKEKGTDVLLPELYGVYSSASEIDWGVLPDRFVAKCTHGSGYNILCYDKTKLDKTKAADKLKKWLKDDYWKYMAELQYKYIKPRIIIEEFLGNAIYTYKFYCFNGAPKIMYVSYMGENGEKDHYVDYYDMNWNRLNIKLEGHENSPFNVKEPLEFEEMKSIARDLSKDFKFVRVDLYDVNGKIYLSELTFIPTAGFMRIEPEGVLAEWGKWLTL